jgi:hypothetical protein
MVLTDRAIVRSWVYVLQAWLQKTFAFAEAAPPAEGKSKFPIWAIVLIGAVVLICGVIACAFFLLVLLGPAIGNVFDEINNELTQ